MTQSVHMITTGSIGSRKTSTAEQLTDYGYEILKILKEFSDRSEFDISATKPTIDGIAKKYHAQFGNENFNTLKTIIKAELEAFTNLGLSIRKDSALRQVGSDNNAQYHITNEGKARIKDHEQRLKTKKIEAQKAAEIPPKDPSLTSQIHFSVLEAIQSYTDQKRPNGTIKSYILSKATQGNRSLREEANAAFEALKTQECFIIHQPQQAMPARFKLSAHGKNILNTKPERFPEKPVSSAATQGPTRHR